MYIERAGKIHITNCLRVIRNAWHFYYALVCFKGFKGSVLTNSLRGIQHAWHFWYALVSVLKCHAETWSLRASPLNWALTFKEEN